MKDHERPIPVSLFKIVKLVLLGHTGGAPYGAGKDKSAPAGGVGGAGQQAPAVSFGADERKEYLVGSEALSVFEGEVRKLRTMQAEALAGYHEVWKMVLLYSCT